jgi:FkbM family methyltransferase
MIRIKNSRALARFIARQFPGFSRIALRCFGSLLPNRWFFYFMVRECGGRATTRARLGNGMRIKVFLGDLIGCYIWHDGWYEPHTIEAIRPFLKSDVSFFDLGANVGQYSLYAAPLVRAVHSFEPVPSTFKLLKWNVQHNQLYNVYINNAAVSDNDGRVKIFELDASNRGAASLSPPRNRNGHEWMVKCFRLDAYLASLPVEMRPRKAFVKMDVEGAELLVLKGAPEFMEMKPIVMLEAVDDHQRKFGNSLSELVAFLKDRGYVLRSLTVDGVVPYGSEHPNILAIPAD